MVNENDKKQIHLVRKQFSGRVFQDTSTGETVKIRDDILPGECIVIGNCYIDVGDGHYARWGGKTLKELTKK